MPHRPAFERIDFAGDEVHQSVAADVELGELRVLEAVHALDDPPGDRRRRRRAVAALLDDDDDDVTLA